MNNQQDIEKIILNKNEAINQLNSYLDNCIIKDATHVKKANLLSFWIKTHTKYLSEEETFNSSTLKSYHRGDVIKVNLGFNVGNEEGGLHYCVILDKKNVQSYSTLTIVPLSSIKPSTKIRNTSVNLGNELYISLMDKYNLLHKEAVDNLKQVIEELHYIETLPENTEAEIIIKDFKFNEISKVQDVVEANIEQLEKIYKELLHMKTGSIALVNQITTISKQRIYNPKNDNDILSGISISNDKMKLIDEKLKKLFID